MLNNSNRGLFLLPDYHVKFSILCLMAFLTGQAVLSQSNMSKMYAQKHINPVPFPTTGTWTVQNEDNELRVQLYTDGPIKSNFVFFATKAEFEANVQNSQKRVIKRDAGVLSLESSSKTSTSEGKYSFQTDKNFLSNLASMGISNPTTQDAFMIFLAPIAFKDLQSQVSSLKEEGYSNLSLTELMSLKDSKVNPAYIKQIRSTGLKNLSVSDLISLRLSAIEYSYINDIKNELKSSEISSQDVLSLKVAGVDQLYIESLKDVNITSLLPAQIISIKVSGIDAQLVDKYKKSGYPKLELKELVKYKASGLTPEILGGYTRLGFPNLSYEILSNLKIHDVTPDYIESMKKKGIVYSDVSKYISQKDSL